MSVTRNILLKLQNSNLQLDQASLLWLTSVGTVRMLASLLGLRQTEQGSKRARIHMLLCQVITLFARVRCLGGGRHPAPSQKTLSTRWGVESLFLLLHRPSHIQPHGDAGP